MGFFSRKEKPKYPKLKPSTYLEPPNVFVAPAQDASNPPVPPRPKTAGAGLREKTNVKDKENRRIRYTQHNNASTPQLQITAGPDSQHHLEKHPQTSQQQIQHYNCGPVIVNQYYLHAPPPHYHNDRSPYSGLADGGHVTGSFANLARDFSKVPGRGDGLCAWYGYGTQVFGSTISTFDDIAFRLNNVLTLIDNESLKGNEMDLFACRQLPPPETQPSSSSKPSKKSSKDNKDKGCKVQPTAEVAASVIRGNYFSKVELYANSKLPKNLDPFAVYGFSSCSLPLVNPS